MNPLIAVGAAGAILISPLTFIPGCELNPPKITSRYSAPGRPFPRGQNASVDIFFAGKEPGPTYLVLGDIEVQARSRNTSLLNLLDHARREARRLGGDAVMDVRVEERAPAQRGACGGAPPARLTLTGRVVRR